MFPRVLALGNTALQEKAKEAQVQGEERYRHDRETARREAEETA